jgi:hypothetical protein
VKTQGHIILDLIPNQGEGSRRNSFSIENQRQFYARNKYTSKLKDSWYTVNPSKIVYSKPNGDKIEKLLSK